MKMSYLHLDILIIGNTHWTILSILNEIALKWNGNILCQKIDLASKKVKTQQQQKQNEKQT